MLIFRVDQIEVRRNLAQEISRLAPTRTEQVDRGSPPDLDRECRERDEICRCHIVHVPRMGPLSADRLERGPRVRSATAQAHVGTQQPSCSFFVLGVQDVRETRTWRSIGRQEVPVRLHLHDADAVAAFVGGSLATDYGRLKASAAGVYGRFGPTDALASALRRHASTVLAYTDAERTTVEEVLDWLLATDVAGLRPRQLPIRGVDSKWFTSHRTVLSALHAAITGAASLGVVDSDPLVRVRILDPRIAPGGIQDFSAPARQLASLTFEPRIALVVENLETLLALPSWPGIVAIHGSGYAVDVLGGLPWLLRTPIVYWGDLDSHGFAILHRLRTAHPDVTTALMDIATLDAHRDLWVPEPKPTRGTFSTLTEQESGTLSALRAAGDVRLEQERIPWAYALTGLERSVLGPSG